MLARMLFQSWRFSIKRKFLAVVTIFLAAGLVSALLAVSIDIGDKMAKELKSYGANILVEPASNACLLYTSFLHHGLSSLHNRFR